LLYKVYGSKSTAAALSFFQKFSTLQCEPCTLEGEENFVKLYLKNPYEKKVELKILGISDNDKRRESLNKVHIKVWNFFVHFVTGFIFLVPQTVRTFDKSHIYALKQS
jgi:hypothetical protein